MVGGDRVAGQRGQQPGEVRRAARARVPRQPVRRRVLVRAVVAGAQVQRVGVEEVRAVERGRAGDHVVQRAFHLVGVPRLAGGQQHPPVPLEARDRGAGLAVRPVGRQLVRVAERLVAVPGALRAGHVGLGAERVVPQPARGGQQLVVVGLHRDVHRRRRAGRAGARRARRPRPASPHRYVVLQVRRAEPSPSSNPRPRRSTNRLARSRYGRWPVTRYSSTSAVSISGCPSTSSTVAEPLDDQVREPAGDRDELRRRRRPVPRHGGLDEVAGAVQLVAPVQLLPPLVAARPACGTS